MAHSTLARPSDLSPVLSLFIERILAKPQLGACCFETVIPHGSTGEEDEVFPCTSSATVHDLATDQEYCAGHFAEVNRA
jgi:hypothetical protein